MVLVKEGEARTLDREEKPCLRQDFPKVEEELGEESLFTYLEHLLGVQFKILNTMSQLGTSEKENKIVFEMTELHQKYRKLIEEMYDLQFEKMKEVEISEIVGNSNMVDTSNKVVVKDKTFG